MAKRSREVSHDSSDDDEAPEAVSFGTSKKAAKGAQDALQQHHTAQKQKQKEKNRAIDRALKDRAANTNSKGKTVVVESSKQSKKVEATLDEDGEEESEINEEEEGAQEGPSRKELEERMARAMMEAEDESGSEDDEGFAGSGDDVEMDREMSDKEDESEDEDEDEDEEQSDGDEDEDEEMESEDEDGEDDEDEDASTRPLSAPRKDDYLPDHLFKSALSHAGKKIVFDDDAPHPSAEASPPRKRKRTKRISKDVLLGSRTIRTLPKSNAVLSSAVTKGLAPPRRVDKFVKTSLNLKGDSAKAKSKGWNRQPANLGVMKRHGPAAHFVRAS